MTDKTDPDSVYHLKNARGSLVAARDDMGVPLHTFRCDLADDQQNPQWQGSMVNLNEQRMNLAYQVRDHIAKAMAGIDALLKS